MSCHIRLFSDVKSFLRPHYRILWHFSLSYMFLDSLSKKFRNPQFINLFTCQISWFFFLNNFFTRISSNKCLEKRHVFDYKVFQFQSYGIVSLRITKRLRIRELRSIALRSCFNSNNARNQQKFKIAFYANLESDLPLIIPIQCIFLWWNNF